MKDKYDLCFQKLLEFQQLLKTQVILLIFDFTRPHAITYTNMSRGCSRSILLAEFERKPNVYSDYRISVRLLHIKEIGKS